MPFIYCYEINERLNFNNGHKITKSVTHLVWHSDQLVGHSPTFRLIWNNQLFGLAKTLEAVAVFHFCCGTSLNTLTDKEHVPRTFKAHFLTIAP
jgi:hypothetical protein